MQKGRFVVHDAPESNPADRVVFTTSVSGNSGRMSPVEDDPPLETQESYEKDKSLRLDYAAGAKCRSKKVGRFSVYPVKAGTTSDATSQGSDHRDVKVNGQSLHPVGVDAVGHRESGEVLGLNQLHDFFEVQHQLFRNTWETMKQHMYQTLLHNQETKLMWKKDALVNEEATAAASSHIPSASGVRSQSGTMEKTTVEGRATTPTSTISANSTAATRKLDDRKPTAQLDQFSTTPYSENQRDAIAIYNSLGSQIQEVMSNNQVLEAHLQVQIEKTRVLTEENARLAEMAGENNVLADENARLNRQIQSLMRMIPSAVSPTAKVEPRNQKQVISSSAGQQDAFSVYNSLGSQIQDVVEKSQQLECENQKLKQEADDRKAIADENIRLQEQIRSLTRPSPPASTIVPGYAVSSSSTALPPVHSQTLQRQVTPQALQSQVTPQALQSQVTPQALQPQVQPQVLQPQVQAQVLPSQVQAQVLQPQVQAQVLQPQVQAQVLQPQVQAQVLQPQVQAQVLQPQVQAQVLQPQVQAQVLQPQVQAQVLQPQAQVQVLQPQVTQAQGTLHSPLQQAQQQPLSQQQLQQQPLAQQSQQQPLAQQSQQPLAQQPQQQPLSQQQPQPLPQLPPHQQPQLHQIQEQPPPPLHQRPVKPLFQPMRKANDYDHPLQPSPQSSIELGK